MGLIYTHNTSARKFKRVIKNKSYYKAVKEQKKYLKSLGIDPDRKIDREQFRAFGNWWESNDTRGRSSVGRTPHLHCGGQEFDSPRLHQKVPGNGGTKPTKNWRLEESQKFTVAPAYNKGAYQVITKKNIKDIGR